MNVKAVYGGLKTTKNFTISYSILKKTDDINKEKIYDDLSEDIFEALPDEDKIIRINGYHFKDITTCIADSTETIEELKSKYPGVLIATRTDEVGKAFWEHFGLKAVELGCTKDITMISKEWADKLPEVNNISIEKLKSKIENIIDVWELESYLQVYEKDGILDELINFILKDEVLSTIYSISKENKIRSSKNIITFGILSYTFNKIKKCEDSYFISKVVRKYIRNTCADDPFAYKFYIAYKFYKNYKED